MDNQKRDKALSIDKETKIQVMLNRPESESHAVEIDLGRVFHRMKLRSRIYAWVLVLCLTIGVCAPLLLYQFTKPELTVTSVVTLNYEAVYHDKDDPDNQWKDRVLPVYDLTAPDGTELDLTQVTSAFVLQNALNGLELSGPVTISGLRRIIVIERILTEESRRQQEVAASMIEQKNNAAFTQVQEMELTYDNKFVVSLTNGFTDADSDKKTELKEEELRNLLDRVLASYNDYLVTTYLDAQMPPDEISLIDLSSMDVLESLDLLRTAEQSLYDYCDGKPDRMKEYRSSKTGKSLTDWMQDLETAAEVNIDYLYSYVYVNHIAGDREALVNSYRYQLRSLQAELERINTNLEDTKTTLSDYKNEEIFVSMRENDSVKSTRAATRYYNSLVLSQMENYKKAAELEIKISDMEGIIGTLESAGTAKKSAEVETELAHAVASMETIYEAVRDHMQEVLASAEYTHYAMYSTAYGRQESFLAASAKKMVLGAAVGGALACVMWFISALMPELQRKNVNRKETGAKEA